MTYTPASAKPAPLGAHLCTAASQHFSGQALVLQRAASAPNNVPAPARGAIRNTDSPIGDLTVVLSKAALAKSGEPVHPPYMDPTHQHVSPPQFASGAMPRKPPPPPPPPPPPQVALGAMTYGRGSAVLQKKPFWARRSVARSRCKPSGEARKALGMLPGHHWFRFGLILVSRVSGQVHLGGFGAWEIANFILVDLR